MHTIIQQKNVGIGFITKEERRLDPMLLSEVITEDDDAWFMGISQKPKDRDCSGRQKCHKIQNKLPNQVNVKVMLLHFFSHGRNYAAEKFSKGECSEFLVVVLKYLYETVRRKWHEAWNDG